MKIKTLNNGVKVITYKNDNAYSATIGVWVRVGSVDEEPQNAGISHFIEHMMFKGTKTKTAKDIAFSMDSVGGQINAFTSKECTCYNATVTYEHIDRAVSLLADMLNNSLMSQVELDKERGVILEEINMVDDAPDDVVHRLHNENFFHGSAIANSVIGSRETVSALNSEDLKKYIQKHYTGDRIVVSVAGRFDEDKLFDLIEKEFSELNPSNNIGKVYDCGQIVKKDSNIAFKNMQTEQTHICLGFPGLSLKSKELYDLHILNNILGGNMSSRLFQNVREAKGLCYTVFSYTSTFMNTGGLTIYSASNKNQVRDLVSVALSEINSIIKEGPTKEEIQMAKEQMKGSYILGLESTSGRMSSMGRQLLLKDEVNTPEEVINKINAVNYDSIMNIANKVFDSNKMTATFVGNIDENDCKSFLD